MISPVSGKGSLHKLAEDMPMRVQRLVTAPIVAAHNGIDHDRRSVIERARSVISQDHRIGNSLRVRSEPSQREDVVPVEARVGHLHPDPPFGDLRFGSVAQDKTGHWIV